MIEMIPESVVFSHNDLQWLDEQATAKGVTIGAIVREAVGMYRTKVSKKPGKHGKPSQSHPWRNVNL